MPYIITTTWYPSEKAVEVTEKFFEVLKKYPPDENIANRIVPAAVTTTQQGIKTMAISEVKEGKLEEALTRSGNMMAMLMNISAFEYSIDVYSTITEALATIGMKLPE